MSWLQEHIENFVEPILEGSNVQLSLDGLNYFNPEELSIIKNSWRSVKRLADGKPILLPGRDVWIFEVLARREGYPTLFLPECSRQTVGAMATAIPGLATDSLFLFDTGFA